MRELTDWEERAISVLEMMLTHIKAGGCRGKHDDDMKILSGFGNAIIDPSDMTAEQIMDEYGITRYALNDLIPTFLSAKKIPGVLAFKFDRLEVLGVMLVKYRQKFREKLLKKSPSKKNKPRK